MAVAPVGVVSEQSAVKQWQYQTDNTRCFENVRLTASKRVPWACSLIWAPKILCSLLQLSVRFTMDRPGGVHSITGKQSCDSAGGDYNKSQGPTAILCYMSSQSVGRLVSVSLSDKDTLFPKKTMMIDGWRLSIDHARLSPGRWSPNGRSHKFGRENEELWSCLPDIVNRKCALTLHTADAAKRCTMAFHSICDWVRLSGYELECHKIHVHRARQPVSDSQSL